MGAFVSASRTEVTLVMLGLGVDIGAVIVWLHRRWL
jgi:hypothetical protein